MLRSSVGWCCAILVVAGGLNACGNSTGDEATGKGGTGSVIGGSGGSGGTDTAGTRTGGGTGGTTACDPTPTCSADNKTLNTCDDLTGEKTTLDCVADSAAVGLIVSGCETGATGAYCAVTDFADEDCKAGKEVAQHCDPTITSTEAIQLYIACFKDTNGTKATLTCLPKYVTPTMMTTADCNKALDICLGNGAGGEGAGGAAPEPTGGAGGAGGAP